MSRDTRGRGAGIPENSAGSPRFIQDPLQGSIHLVGIRTAEIIATDPEEVPLALRAEMGAGRRGTATAVVLQEELLAASRTAVTVHQGTIGLLCIKPGHQVACPAGIRSHRFLMRSLR